MMKRVLIIVLGFIMLMLGPLVSLGILAYVVGWQPVVMGVVCAFAATGLVLLSFKGMMLLMGEEW